jgi:hypothetical protein
MFMIRYLVVGLVSSMAVRLNGELHRQVGEHSMEAFHRDHNAMLSRQHSKRDATSDMTGLETLITQE